MASIRRLEARLRAQGPVILDGANGTELERLGVRMDQDVWCARALADCPEMVHEVHRRYIDAGADVITTNSFAATRDAMQRHGLATHFEDWNRRSVRIAREERDRSSRAESIVVAGSVSSYGRFDKLDFETNSDHFRAQGEILVDEGVDLLILEAPGSASRTIEAMNATRDLGVPVWVSRHRRQLASSVAQTWRYGRSPVPSGTCWRLSQRDSHRTTWRLLRSGSRAHPCPRAGIEGLLTMPR